MRSIPYADGPYHNFWLFREGERAYNDYRDLLPRRDAPVRLPDDVYGALSADLKQLHTVNPGKRANPPGMGLNHTGVSVINESGGAAFGALCRKAAKEWAQGPKRLVLHHSYYGAVFVNDKRMPNPYKFKIRRDPLVRDLEKLAGWGEKAATGKLFILRVGI